MNGCRPFFGIDEYHLKGLKICCIHSVIARDTNSGMFLIAIAWVEVKTRDSSKWLLEFLTRYIGFGPQSVIDDNV